MTAETALIPLQQCRSITDTTMEEEEDWMFVKKIPSRRWTHFLIEETATVLGKNEHPSRKRAAESETRTQIWRRGRVMPCIKRAGRVLEPPAATARQTEISCSLFIPHQPEQVLSAGQSAAPATTCPLRFLQDADRWSRSTSCCASVRVSQARQHKYANAAKSEEERVD